MCTPETYNIVHQQYLNLKKKAFSWFQEDFLSVSGAFLYMSYFGRLKINEH